MIHHRLKQPNIKHPVLYLIIILGISAFAVIGIFWQWGITSSLQASFGIMNQDISSMEKPTDALAVRVKKNSNKPEKREVKGLYLTAYSANNPNKVDSIIDLINSTELNSVVIDIKDYSGYVMYDSNLLWVNEFRTEKHRIEDVQKVISKFHKNNIYVIARQTVFQDPILAERKPEFAIHNKAGGLWRDKKGLAWVDPTNESVWNYNVSIAKEAIRLGFDEINFDYVRFPSDGNLSEVVYTNGDKTREEIMHDFFAFLDRQLSHESAWISVDMFGFVMERDDGLFIGQRLIDAVDYVDYISPMMYPSHYPAGHLGLSNPAEFPSLVITNGMEKGMPKFEARRAQVRPWIQAFNIGANYGAVNIRAQIDAVEKYSNGGWLLWNASNRYSNAGLNPRKE